MNRKESIQLSVKLYLAYLAYRYAHRLNSISVVRRKRRCWVRENIKCRDKLGFYETTFLRIKESSPDQFFKATRMSRELFELLLSLIQGKVTKTSARKPICPEARLAVTLIYLAQGCSKQLLARTFRMGVTTIRIIVLEVCETLWEVLSPIYLTVPGPNKFAQIAKAFAGQYGLPNCVGVADGKHIRIKCPPNPGPQFYSYKGVHSVVLLGVCDTNYCFTMVDIGANGTPTDGRNFSESGSGNQLLQGELTLPKPIPLPGGQVNFPHYFVGTATFPLKTWLMKPFPGRQLPVDRQHYNDRLQKAQSITENAFGILQTRWRIISTTVDHFPENTEKVIMAAVVLHNFIIQNNVSQYCPPNFVDSADGEDGLWRSEVHQLESTHLLQVNNANRDAISLRKRLCTYLNNVQHVG